MYSLEHSVFIIKIYYHISKQFCTFSAVCKRSITTTAMTHNCGHSVSVVTL
ncbi:hypothetical protein NC651_030606 [Populus alba x Populus x berolinensis]|nr:hypothetical protein NC651_030606 [Populus alba x Populus x berolinensis]